MTPRSTLARTGLLGSLFVGLALVMIRPTRPDSLRENLADPALILWQAAWPGRALVTDPTGLFQSPLYWPNPDTYAYSDVLLTQSGPYWLFYGLTGSWTLASIAVGLLLAVLAEAGAYLLAERITGRRDAAVVAAVGFAFGGYGLGRSASLQLATIGCFALAVVALLRFLDEPTWPRAVLLAVANLATFYGSLYYGALWFLLLGGTCAVTVVRRLLARDPTSARFVLRLGAAGAITLAGVAPTVRALFRLQDDLEQLRVLSPEYDLLRDDLLRPAEGSYLWSGLLDPPTSRALYEHRFFPGAIAIVLATVGVSWLAVRLVRRARLAPDDRPRAGVDLAIVLAMGAVGVAFARGASGFGPVSPWRFVYEHVPGFSGVRATSRLAVPALLAGSTLVAVGYAAMARRWLRTPRAVAVAVVLTVAATCLDLAAPLRWVPVDTDAATLAVYRELADRPAGAVVELPMPPPSPQWPFLESPRMLYSTLDWHPRVNGYSGHFPPEYPGDAAVYSRFPAPEAVDRLRSKRVRYVLLHVGEVNGVPQLTESEADAITRALPPGATSARFGDAHLVDLGSSEPR